MGIPFRRGTRRGTVSHVFPAESMHEEVQQKTFGFTPREFEIVLQQLAAGCSNEEIADYFKISEEDLNNIFDKLGVSRHRIRLAFIADKFKT